MREWGHPLVTGKLGFAAIAKMAWQAIIAMLPPVLIRLLIEKLVALIVPAAAAIMAIVEALQAAWGTISAIMAALDTFIAFLKAVKGGGAGPQFTKALASAAVVVLDFVANFLLLRLAMGLAKLAGKLMGFARRMMRKLRKRRGGRKRGRGRGKPRGRGRNDADRRDREQRAKRARIERARRELPPKVSNLIAQKPSRIRLAIQLRIWKAIYRMRTLEAKGTENLQIKGVINPTIDCGHGWTFKDAHLMRLVKEVAEEIVLIQDPVPQASVVEPSSGLELKDLTGKVNVTSAMTKAARLKLGDGVERDHRATPLSVVMGGSRAIVEPGKDGGPSYPQLQSALGGSNPGKFWESLFKNPKQPNTEGLDPKQQSAAGTIFGLFLKEATHPKGTGRHGRDLLHGAMLTQLLNSSTPEHAITSKEAIDLFPAGFGGAQAGTRTITNKLSKPGFLEFILGKLGRNARERHKRETQLLEKWGKMHLPQWQTVHTTKPNDADIKQLIRQTLAPLLARFKTTNEPIG